MVAWLLKFVRLPTQPVLATKCDLTKCDLLTNDVSMRYQIYDYFCPKLPYRLVSWTLPGANRSLGTVRFMCEIFIYNTVFPGSVTQGLCASVTPSCMCLWLCPVCVCDSGLCVSESGTGTEVFRASFKMTDDPWLPLWRCNVFYLLSSWYCWSSRDEYFYTYSYILKYILPLESLCQYRPFWLRVDRLVLSVYWCLGPLKVVCRQTLVLTEFLYPKLFLQSYQLQSQLE
jgi:hypothetical protein